MSSHGLAGEELTKRPLNARTSKQNGNCNARSRMLAQTSPLQNSDIELKGYS
jgi:hypothetical protein